MILIVSSTRDEASLNIKEGIVRKHDFREVGRTFASNSVYEKQMNGRTVELITLNEEAVQSQNLIGSFNDLELVLFISRHSSTSGTPTLSVHAPGNLAAAELGGIPRRVSVAPANAMREALKMMIKLKEEKSLNYEVSYEGTHHGPSLDVPTMFVELGSSRIQWGDRKAAETVADASMEAVKKFDDRRAKAVVGIGGPHYNNRFTRMALEKELAFGHMIPKYAVSNIDLHMLNHCIERTLEKVETVILDWKGTKGEDKQRLVRILAETGISFEKS